MERERYAVFALSEFFILKERATTGMQLIFVSHNDSLKVVYENQINLHENFSKPKG